MYSQVTSIFLSMALIAAFQSFSESSRAAGNWLAFIYFVLNNIRYLYGDIRWGEEERAIRREDLGFERAVDTMLYVITRFTVVIVAFYIKNIEAFFWFSGLALGIGSACLIFSGICIYDRQKDASGPELMRVWWHWLVFNFVEMAVVLVAGFLLHVEGDIIKSFPSLSNVSFRIWVTGIAFAILFLVMMIDWVMHQSFLFRPTTPSRIDR